MGKRLSLVLTLAVAIAIIGTALAYAGARGVRAQLTDDQRAAVQAKVQELKEAGDPPEAIRAAVRTMLKEEYGIEVPERHGPRLRHGGGPFAQLTEDQRAAVQAKVQELKANGASHEDIRTAVGEMLQGYGIQPPEQRGPRPGLGWKLRAQLTEDQRTQIREMVQGMRASGASREDIHTAIRGKLREFGIQVPELTPSASLSAAKTTAVQSASWGEIKSRFR